jgi:hypothetical protein
MKYKIVKYVDAKNIKEAIKLEPNSDIDEIIKDEPEQREIPNSHLVGFYLPPSEGDFT